MINELYGVFAVLKDIKKFESVFIDEVGNVAWDIDENIDSSIHWEKRIDLCKDMLYLESTAIHDITLAKRAKAQKANFSSFTPFLTDN